MKMRKCISCNDFIYKGARLNPYLCRNCESEIDEEDLVTPIYHGKFT